MFNFFGIKNFFPNVGRKNGRKGVAIYLAISTLSVVMAVALGVSALSIYQIKNMNEAGNSVIAFAAAETGIEWAEYQCYADTPLISMDVDPGDPTYYRNACPWNISLEQYTCAKDIPIGSGVSYTVTVATSLDSASCPDGFLCIKSSGGYRGTQRVIKVQQ